jgi:hypothetical protein
MLVALPGIEPGSGASETLILSIVLQGQIKKGTVLFSNRNITPKKITYPATG